MGRGQPACVFGDLRTGRLRCCGQATTCTFIAVKVKEYMCELTGFLWGGALTDPEAVIRGMADTYALHEVV